MENLENIEKALRSGYKLHGFRSGGGLRVFTLKRANPVDKVEYPEFYGESHNLQEGMRILDDDVRDGPRPYKEVYGVIEDHYLTGSYARRRNPVDRWIYGGRKFDIEHDGENFVLDMTTEEHLDTPSNIVSRVSNGETIYWRTPSSRKSFHKSFPYIFPNGSRGCTTVSLPSRKLIYVKHNRIVKAPSLPVLLERAKKKVGKFYIRWKELSLAEVEKFEKEYEKTN